MHRGSYLLLSSKIHCTHKVIGLKHLRRRIHRHSTDGQALRSYAAITDGQRACYAHHSLLNAVDEAGGGNAVASMVSELGRVVQYQGRQIPSGVNDPKAILMSFVRDCVRDGDVFFEKQVT